MTEKEAWGQAFENGRKQGDAEGYARGLKEAYAEAGDLISRKALLAVLKQAGCDCEFFPAVVYEAPAIAAEPVNRGQCEFCDAEDNEFRLLNAKTMAHSGIGIALNRQGLLRVRTYNQHTQFETQDFVRVKFCPNCGARMDGDNDGSRKAN